MRHIKNVCSILTLIISTYLHALTEHAHLDANWYPNKKDALQSTIKHLSKQATQKYNATLDARAIRAIIVPHAGYAFSGTVAASVYRLLDKKRINKVIILAPDHSVSFQGVALPTFDSYQTPLGIINVAAADIKKLSQKKLFQHNREIFSQEHSLEVELPFIQSYLDSSITIVPLLIGKLTCAQAISVAQELKPLINENTLVVVSTDFTHYGKRFNFTPFKDNIAYNIRALDSQVLEQIEHGTCESFTQFMEKSHATICGRYPLEIFLSLLEIGAFGTVEPRLIAYDTSGNQEKNWENSVSYIGMLFTQQKLATLPIEQQLTQQEQNGLLQEAHDILAHLFDRTINQKLLYPIKSYGITRSLGAFTTLEKKTKQGKTLRGCIGRITTDEPLFKTIATVTRDAALHDTRFNPVEKKELPELTLKLSILSAPTPIKSYNDIILGKHGVILQSNGQSAVFLPEVPLEFKWTIAQMLSELSVKAGLTPNAWHNKDTRFKVFTTLGIE